MPNPLPPAAHSPESILDSLGFKGRTAVSVPELGHALGISKQHIIDLIDQGDLGAIDIGRNGRRHYRIPVSEMLQWLLARHSLVTPERAAR